MKGKARIGTSGFGIARLKYIQFFACVEVQHTFYQPPKIPTLERWRAEAPPDFEFVLKAWQLITHDAKSPTYRRLKKRISEDEKQEAGYFKQTPIVSEAWEVTEACARALKARTILFQCPASFKQTKEKFRLQPGDVMAELKTKPTAESVSAFLDKVPDKSRRDDCLAVIDIMKEVTKEEPRMWGSSIVGFGRYRYKYESGREGEWMITGFSPRKGDLTLYIMEGFESSPDLMKRLGKHKTGKSCLYIKKLADVDLKVLKELVEKSVKSMANKRIRREAAVE